MTRHLRPLAACLLAILIAATGYTAATARGTTRVAGTVVLCSGAIYQPGSNGPDADPHICPDMALGLMAALGLVPATATAPDSRTKIAWAPVSLTSAASKPPGTSARAPPIPV